MFWRLIKNIVLLCVVVAFALFLSTGSFSKWQEVRDSLLSVAGKMPVQNEQAVLPSPPNISLDADVKPTKEVTLYFTDAQTNNLIPEKHSIKKVEGIAKETIEALISGPQVSTGHYPVIPEGTKLLGINVKPDGLCIVDFSNELAGNSKNSAVGEKIATYAIVDTLTQFPTIQRVKILINGQEKPTLGGHEIISGELMRDDTLIKK